MIIKLYDAYSASDNPLYPNLPDIEADTLNHFIDANFTPRLIDSWWKNNSEKQKQAILVYEYIDGQHWQNGTHTVAHLLSMLHDPIRNTPPHWLRQLPLSAHDVCLQADKILQHIDHTDVCQLITCRPVRPNKEHLTQLSFVHGDCWGGNFIQSANGLTLIDWQCPGKGDAVEDIANFLSPGMMSFARDNVLSELERQAFFNAYDNDVVIKRYHRDAASWHWRLACYYLYRREYLKILKPKLSLGYRQALEKEVKYLKSLTV